MKKNLQVLLAVLLMIASTTAYAQQNGTIRGRVVDNDKLSLPGATVLITSLNKGTVTDNYGYFTLTNVPAGSQEVSVTYIGYLPAVSAVQVESNRTASVDFELKAGIELSEVTVTGP